MKITQKIKRMYDLPQRRKSILDINKDRIPLSELKVNTLKRRTSEPFISSTPKKSNLLNKSFYLLLEDDISSC